MLHSTIASVVSNAHLASAIMHVQSHCSWFACYTSFSYQCLSLSSFISQGKEDPKMGIAYLKNRTLQSLAVSRSVDFLSLLCSFLRLDFQRSNRPLLSGAIALACLIFYPNIALAFFDCHSIVFSIVCLSIWHRLYVCVANLKLLAIHCSFWWFLDRIPLMCVCNRL